MRSVPQRSHKLSEPKTSVAKWNNFIPISKVRMRNQEIYFTSLPYQQLPPDLQRNSNFMNNWYARHVKTIQTDPAIYIGSEYDLPREASLTFLDGNLIHIQTKDYDIPIFQNRPHGVAKSSSGYMTFRHGVAEGPFDLLRGNQRELGEYRQGMENLQRIVPL